MEIKTGNFCVDGAISNLLKTKLRELLDVNDWNIHFNDTPFDVEVLTPSICSPDDFLDFLKEYDKQFSTENLERELKSCKNPLRKQQIQREIQSIKKRHTNKR